MSMIARQWVCTVLERTHPHRLLCSVQRALFFVEVWFLWLLVSLYLCKRFNFISNFFQGVFAEQLQQKSKF